MKRIFRKKIRGVSGEGGEGRKVWLFPTYYFFQCFLTYVYTFSFLLPTVFSNLSLLARLAAGCCISFLCFLIPKPYPHFFLRMETYIYISMQVAWPFIYARLRLWSKQNSYTVFLLELQTLLFPEYLYYCLGKKGYVFNIHISVMIIINHVWLIVIMQLAAFNIDFSHLLCINKMRIK